MKKLYKDQVAGIILVALAAFFVYQTSLMPESTLQGDPGPAIFPLIACFLIGCCGILMIVNPDKKEGRKFLTPDQWKRMITLYGVYILYWVLLYVVGYKGAIPIILLIVSYMFSRPVKTPIIRIVIYTIGVTAAIFVLYTVILGSKLPQGMIFGR